MLFFTLVGVRFDRSGSSQVFYLTREADVLERFLWIRLKVNYLKRKPITALNKSYLFRSLRLE